MPTLKDALRRHGLLGTLGVAIDRVLSIRQHRAAARASRAFDEAHGVDTAGIVALASLEIESDNVSHGVRYEATTKQAFDLLVGGLPIRHEEFTFVDFGAGKGRALLLAGELPFRRVVGVEFSPELAEVARTNIARYTGPRRCPLVEIVVADAAEYELPDGPVLAYFFNPFAEPVMQTVVANLARSVATSMRPVYAVLTGDAPLGRIFEEAGFERVARGFPGEGPTRGVFVAGLDRA